MICLKNLTRNHSIAIVTSIHQPNVDVIVLFDKLYVLSIGGQCVYNGHPSRLRHHLIQCQFHLRDYQVPIEQLIKVASSIDSNSVLINNLVRKSVDDTNSLEKSLMKEGKLINGNSNKMKKSFSLTDFMIVLRRTARNQLIGGWKMQIGFIFAYFFGSFLMCFLFPNDIGTDPGCPVKVVDLTNISLIDQRILDVLMGNEQKFQQNVKYYFFMNIIFLSLNLIQVCHSFSQENQVFDFFKIKINIHLFFVE